MLKSALDPLRSCWRTSRSSTLELHEIAREMAHVTMYTEQIVARRHVMAFRASNSVSRGRLLKQQRKLFARTEQKFATLADHSKANALKSQEVNLRSRQPSPCFRRRRNRFQLHRCHAPKPSVSPGRAELRLEALQTLAVVHEESSWDGRPHAKDSCGLLMVGN